jgi:D-3-phosphoglycerate dehydrogenase
MRVLVTEPMADSGIALLRDEFEVDERPELAAEGLAEAIAPYAALIVRSQTKVTAEVLDRADELKVVARAGIGLDNVDVGAATRRGILVVNAPQSNILSAAEHTWALLLAQARNIPQASASLRAGRWERGRFEGVEVHGKTLGVIGLGRVGAIVAQRGLGFSMRVVAYDPFVSRDRARQLGVELLPSLEAVLVQADFLTVHLPKTPETVGLVGRRELALVKEGARLVNTARGGIVDERALVEALRDGRLAGAAVDVFENEPPPPSHPLLAMEQVVATPHLGASTVEAQDRAGAAIAEMVRLALHDELVPNAVNVPAGADLGEMARAYLPLAAKLGSIVAGLADGPIHRLEAEYLGGLADVDTRILTLAALRAVLARAVHEPVSFVNAPVIASERGIGLAETTSSEVRDYLNLMVLRAQTERGPVSVAGTLFGRAGERIVRVDDFDVEFPPSEHMVFLLTSDRPGQIGRVGTMLGEAGINIASMQVGRGEPGGRQLMCLTVDTPVPAEILDRIASAIGAERARSLALPS